MAIFNSVWPSTVGKIVVHFSQPQQTDYIFTYRLVFKISQIPDPQSGKWKYSWFEVNFNRDGTVFWNQKIESITDRNTIAEKRIGEGSAKASVINRDNKLSLIYNKQTAAIYINDIFISKMNVIPQNWETGTSALIGSNTPVSYRYESSAN